MEEHMNPVLTSENNKSFDRCLPSAMSKLRFIKFMFFSIEKFQMEHDRLCGFRFCLSKSNSQEIMFSSGCVENDEQI